MNFLVDLHIYPFSIMVSVDQTDSEIDAALNELHCHELDEYAKFEGAESSYHWLWNAKDNQGIICLPEIPETAKGYGSLAHEIFHCVDYIMEEVGMKLTRESDEAYAYAIGYVTMKIYEQFYEFK